MKRLLLLALSMVLCGTMAMAQVNTPPSAEDFLPVVAGGSDQIKQPDAVKVDKEKQVVEAKTMQDAANQAVILTTPQSSEAADFLEEVYEIKAGSGIGYIATGIAPYNTVPNPNATRIIRRNAYLIAYNQAKNNLKNFFSKTKNKALTEIVSSETNQDDATTSTNETSDIIKTRANQVSEGLLRGFVVYQFKDNIDNPEQKFVSVSIISTPKTQGKFNRIDPNTISVDSITEGLDLVLTEIKSGLIPPVGGKLIHVKSTNELAFVGFGSSVVHTVPSTAMAAKMKINALRLAEVRAKDALCGIICGEMVTGTADGKSDTSNEEMSSVDYTFDDPLQENKQDKATEQIKKNIAEFESSSNFHKTVTSARNGILPPGITIRKWISEDKSWAFGVAVYLPSVTAAASKFSQDMRETPIIQPYETNSQNTPSSSNAPQKGQTINLNDAPLPGGIVTPLEEL